jgi:predicted nuclease of predicted toxin-antitoxin system
VLIRSAILGIYRHTSDPQVWRYAYDNDLVVVTTNAKDFVALLGVEVHPGLIVLRENGLPRRSNGTASSRCCNICSG